MKNPDKPLVRIIDDDDPLRTSLRFMLELEGYKVKDYPNADTFLKEDSPSALGCAIIDFRLPGLTGPQLQLEMKERGIDYPIIFLTAYADVDITVTVLKRGAFDLIQKPVNEERLLSAVAAAIKEDRKNRFQQISADDLKTKLSLLTTRENEVVRLVAKGLLNKDIAERLNISLRTVKFHRASAYRKLGLHTSAEIAEYFSNLD